jgi:hypothetical protein
VLGDGQRVEAELVGGAGDALEVAGAIVRSQALLIGG